MNADDLKQSMQI